MDFSDALKHLRAGKALQREPWRKSDLSLVLVPNIGLTGGGPPLEKGTEYRLAPIFVLVSNNVASPWAMPTGDILAEDWSLAESKEDFLA